MTPRARKALLWVFTLVLTGVLLYFFLHKADLHRVLEESRRASLPHLGAALALEILSVFLRAFRWRVMLAGVRERLPISSLLKATVVSYTLSGAMPGRIGEIGKPFLLARWHGLSFTQVLGSSVLERGMDLIALAILWFGYLILPTEGFAPEAEGLLTYFTRLSWVLVAAAVPAGLFLLWLMPRRRIFDRMARRSERLGRYPLLLRVVRALLAFTGGLSTFRKKRTILYVTFLSVAIWLCIAGACWAFLQSLHLDLPHSAGLLLLMFVSFGAAIPTPGGIGGVHKAIQVCLTLFYGVSEDLAVTAGIVGHAVMFFPGILWGLLYLAFGRVRLEELKEAARAEEERKRLRDVPTPPLPGEGP
ncbi:MAG: lysylphosphatidylglycerol synthase transmembrane domain-containing protein [Acidobacteriota bacterium]